MSLVNAWAVPIYAAIIAATGGVVVAYITTSRGRRDERDRIKQELEIVKHIESPEMRKILNEYLFRRIFEVFSENEKSLALWHLNLFLVLLSWIAFGSSLLWAVFHGGWHWLTVVVVLLTIGLGWTIWWTYWRVRLAKTKEAMAPFLALLDDGGDSESAK